MGSITGFFSAAFLAFTFVAYADTEIAKKADEEQHRKASSAAPRARSASSVPSPSRAQPRPQVGRQAQARQSVRQGGHPSGRVARPHAQAAPSLPRQPRPQSIQRQGREARRQPKSGPQYSRTPSMSRINQNARQRNIPPNQASSFDRPRVERRPTIPESTKPTIPPRQRVRDLLKRERPDPKKQPLPPKDDPTTRRPDGKDRPRHDDKNWMSKRRDRDDHGVRKVRDHVRRDFHRHHEWFSDSFFYYHNYFPFYYHHDINWWRRPEWIVIVNWLSPGWTYPIYYDYGGYQIPLPVDVEPYQPADTYYASVINSDWLPLGVFALGMDLDQAAYSTLFIQLAVNRDGDIAGTYYNSSTDQLYPLEGAIINETQQAAWIVADNFDSPLITTGVYNLTQDVVPIQVHFPEGDEQSWVLVRIEQ